jgi:hypothetical protein
MANDLYSADLKSIAGNDLYQAISEFTRIDKPVADRPREGYLLDFKEDLSDRFLHSVAAMANTFGGLLIVGVSEIDGRADKLIGVLPAGEMKTQVASMIASNLFPCPPFEIAECDIPKDPNGKRLCVVRVRETQEICLLAKKGEKYPVYVRIEDQSSPVDASQMRSLMSRKRGDQNLASDLIQRMGELQNNLFVTDGQSGVGRKRSETFFKVVLCPHKALTLPLDLAMESTFSKIVAKLNPGLEDLTHASAAKIGWERSRDWYEVQFAEFDHDYERRWRVTNRADIGFVTQVRWPIAAQGNHWSLYDVAADLVRAAELAKAFWQKSGYFGGFRLQAELRVQGLSFNPGLSFGPLFYERSGHIASFSMDSRGIVLAKQATTSVAISELDGDYANLSDSLVFTVSTTLNQILRCFGHSADIQALQGALSHLIDWVRPR